MRLVAMLTVVALASLPAQAFPNVGADPQGVVLDERLQPIAGAAVTLAWEPRDAVPFRYAIAARLAKSPLAAVQSGRDGSFVLPLTDEQRQMGCRQLGSVNTESGCWLLVEKAGYLPWREPIPGGLSTYLGSRVVLRSVRAGDPFADVPWPPAILTLRQQHGMRPWLPLAGWEPVADRRGGAAPARPAAPHAAADLGTVELEVVTNDQAVGHANVWLFSGTIDPGEQPPRVDAQGQLKMRLPAGGWRILITAAGLLPTEASIKVVAGERQRVDLVMQPAEIVDVLAVTERGTPVPFTMLQFHLKSPRQRIASFPVCTDSLGRARVMLDSADEWSVLSDAQEKIALPRVAGDLAPVKVLKHRPITIKLRGDEWPTNGTLRRERAGEPAEETPFQGVRLDTTHTATRLCTRETDTTYVLGAAGVPFRIRRQDLPPMPDDVLLDLVELDRTLRPRAALEVVPGDVRRLVVVAPWHADEAKYARAAHQMARQVDGGWLLFARDDAPLEAFAAALRLRVSGPLAVPARTPGAPLPRLLVQFPPP